MAEKEYILNALDDLGYPYQDGGKVGGWRGNTVQAEFKVTSNRPGYDIGFVKTADNYEMVADWSMIGDPKFMERLTQRYAYHTTRAKLASQGFTLVTEENQQDGRIHLLVRRVV